MKPSVMRTNPNLRDERIQQGWSQKKLAQALGVTTRTVIRWEKGDVVPHPSHREQLRILLGKTVEELSQLRDTGTNKAIEQAPFSVTQHARPAVVVQASSLTDPANLKTLDQCGLLGRAGLFMQVKRRLLEGESLSFTAMRGLPGIGQTGLAIALTMDQEVQAHFCDGILWASLGDQPDRLGHLTHWGTLLGAAPTNVRNPETPRSWGRALRAAIGTQRMLLVIDDAWTVEDALALQIGGVRCSSLLITRQSQVALAFGKQGVIVVPQLEETDGLVLLARYIPHLIQQDPEGALALVQAVGSLPWALALMGKYLVLPTFRAYRWPLRAALAELHDTQECLRFSMLTASGQRSPDPVETVPLWLYAIIAICAQRLSRQAHAALCALAVFPPKPRSFSEQAALMMSCQPREVLEELWVAGLLESWEPRRYTLHQTVVDYVRTCITPQYCNDN